MKQRDNVTHLSLSSSSDHDAAGGLELSTNPAVN